VNSRKGAPRKNGDPSHAEAFQLHAKAENAIARFIDSEIDIGLLFCRIASQRPDGERRRSFLEKARRAHEVARQSSWKLNMPHSDLDALATKLEKLKSHIELLVCGDGVE
jgi:hypothetical protein